MIYRVFLRTSDHSNSPAVVASLSGTFWQIVEWAAFHNMQFVHEFSNDDLRIERGFSVFTVRREDALPLTQHEIDAFVQHTGHLGRNVLPNSTNKFNHENATIVDLNRELQ